MANKLTKTIQLTKWNQMETPLSASPQGLSQKEAKLDIFFLNSHAFLLVIQYHIIIKGIFHFLCVDKVAMKRKAMFLLSFCRTANPWLRNHLEWHFNWAINGDWCGHKRSVARSAYYWQLKIWEIICLVRVWPWPQTGMLAWAQSAHSRWLRFIPTSQMNTISNK